MRTVALVWSILAAAASPGAASGQLLPSGASPSTLQCDSAAPASYVLGPDDEVEVAGPELDERGAITARVDGDGEIQLPLVGRVRVAGLTVQQAQQELNTRYGTYIREPQVTIGIRELRSQPVSMLGALNSPGVHQVRGRKTLLEMISVAGGLRPDAGDRIRITRRLDQGCLPLASARVDAGGQLAIAEASVADMMSGGPGNIEMLPHDVVSVPRAEMVYVIGDVRRSGGFVIGDGGAMSILKVLSLAEGLNATADRKHARLLRPAAGGQRVETVVDIKAILEGRSEDLALQADDILFIPASGGKKASLRALDTAIQAGTGLLTGLLIWR
jgi:polysaccharide export outer membrane protein